MCKINALDIQSRLKQGLTKGLSLDISYSNLLGHIYFTLTSLKSFLLPIKAGVLLPRSPDLAGGPHYLGLNYKMNLAIRSVVITHFNAVIFLSKSFHMTVCAIG